LLQPIIKPEVYEEGTLEMTALAMALHRLFHKRTFPIRIQYNPHRAEEIARAIHRYLVVNGVWMMPCGAKSLDGTIRVTGVGVSITLGSHLIECEATPGHRREILAEALNFAREIIRMEEMG
jgi:hypothetical protein